MLRIKLTHFVDYARRLTLNTGCDFTCSGDNWFTSSGVKLARPPLR
jgi:hypothetical protein